MSMVKKQADPVVTTHATASPHGRPRWRRFGRLIGYCFLVALALVFIGPLVWMILTSLKPQSAVFAGPIFPRHLQLGAYSYVWDTLGIGTTF